VGELRNAWGGRPLLREETIMSESTTAYLQRAHQFDEAKKKLDDIQVELKKVTEALHNHWSTVKVVSKSSGSPAKHLTICENEWPSIGAIKSAVVEVQDAVEELKVAWRGVPTADKKHVTSPDKITGLSSQEAWS
jgi:hypothetical protein